MAESQRPDPDQLLRQIQQEELKNKEEDKAALKFSSAILQALAKHTGCFRKPTALKIRELILLE